jgi:hypothetical protein
MLRMPCSWKRVKLGGTKLSEVVCANFFAWSQVTPTPCAASCGQRVAGHGAVGRDRVSHDAFV